MVKICPESNYRNSQIIIEMKGEKVHQFITDSSCDCCVLLDSTIAAAAV